MKNSIKDTIKTIIKILLINGFILLILLYLFEFFFSPFSDMKNSWTTEEYTWGHEIENNQLGYREREITTPKPDDVFRIVVFGDSLTWGVGLAEQERYTAIAEKKLALQFPDKKIEVLNFGVSGYPTTKERDDLFQHHKTLSPDLILIAFCFNDPQPKGQDWSVEYEKYQTSFLGQLVTFSNKVLVRLKLNYTAQQIYHLYYGSLIRIGKIPVWQTALQRTYEPTSKEWQDFIQALQAIKNLSDKLDLPAPFFAVLNQGTHKDKPTHYSKPDKHLQQFLKWYDQAENAAQSIGFNTYNHRQEIIEQIDHEILTVNKFDGHPSKSLNRIFGDKLSEKLMPVIAVIQ